MRKITTLIFLAAVISTYAYSQSARIATAYSYPLLPGSPLDTLLHNTASCRGVGFSNDADGDGKAEVAITNYNGRVHVFTVVGNDSLELVWTSPKPIVGGGSTPRTVIFGDLDNDGRQEVIYQVSGDGIYIFEWDGVVGSHNFGTLPSQIITSPPIAGLTGSVEYMEVADVDGDGENELCVAYNGTPNANDRYYVISAVGAWDTDNPGFSSFSNELELTRTNLGIYSLDAGSPYAVIPANFDGVGNKELLLHGWWHKNVVPVRVTGPNTYAMPDTTAGKQKLMLSDPDDFVSLMGAVVCDIDGDGRDEVYLPTWYGASVSENSTKVHMVFYNPGSSTSQIDTSNARAFDLRSVIGDPDPNQSYSANTLGVGYGDLDGNGKKNIYFSGINFSDTLGFNIVSMEYQGGDKRDQANWKLSTVYRGESRVIESMTIRDSSGRRDTTKVPWAAQVAHMWGRNTDFDKDGKQDLLMPMQGWFNTYMDSTKITKLTWNQSGSKYDTVQTTVANPRRWIFRVLEGTGTSSVELKDLTVITPDDYVLEQNYPNPFNPSTTISFSLPMTKRISLVVYDLLGKEVKTLINGQDVENGSHSILWDGTNNANMPVASGTYFCTLNFGNFQKSQKMMLVR
jgi:hypothetical protein